MSRHYFGTDGVRGPYGGPLINETFAAQLGHAAGRWLRSRSGRGQLGRILVGRDTRASGEALAAAVARGLQAAGLEVASLGILPTPAVARAVRMSGAPLGVVITASHNPAADNGIKFFGAGGIKLTDADELAIESQLQVPVTLPTAAMVTVSGAVQDYIDAAQSLLPADSLRGWRVVLDTANGATCGTSGAVLRALGAEVLPLGDRPDGQNINAGVGSEHPGLLAAQVRAAGARLGIAHDGDGDRCVVCDENGEVLDGDEVLTLLGLEALRTGRLAKQTLVVTVQSNLGVDAAIAAAGGRVLRTSVGDRYVMARMLEEGASLGGESSGHIIFSEVSPTGDGLVAALKVIAVMQRMGEPLSRLRRQLRRFPQRTAALKVREKIPVERLPGLSAVILALESELGAEGRVLVRYSGTEAKLRLLIEGPTDEVVNEGMARLEAASRRELDVA